MQRDSSRRGYSIYVPLLLTQLDCVLTRSRSLLVTKKLLLRLIFLVVFGYARLDRIA
jgi:hypothetical protein